MPVWLEIEGRIAQMPSTHPARMKLLDRVNFFGQVTELDHQGRVLIQQRLRDSAQMSGRGRRAGPAEFSGGLEPRTIHRQADARPVHRRDAKALADFGI